MKNLILSLFISIFIPISCQQKKDIAENKNIIDSSFIGNLEITNANYINNYFSEASGYLDSLKTPYKNYEDNKIIGFKHNNEFIRIASFKSPWYLIFFENGKYKTLDMINIKNEYPKFFNHQEHTALKNLDSKKIIDSIAKSKYFTVEEKDADLNNDTFTDKVIVLGNNDDIDPQNPNTKVAPILILLNEQNKKYRILTNENIYPNDFGDVFKKLVIKNQFFTIELTNEVPDNYSTDKYITFRFDGKLNEIILSKYGENVHWNDGTQNNILCSEKNFGKLSFQEFNSNTIRNQCSH
ncbi:MAG: hypothetical protein LBE92_18965 [Chryseobacterium sp.]|jgi:hypothetical protein|uniref:hypothetical protein n=1 Tax=Chryseobacterium sp. TaxID=1871047 RepID=UPI002820C386|nr:hypothetical protein [Chryseobacterium sp.]MDR2238211.1 hypothetical protein [Chryseobacterium sp.]